MQNMVISGSGNAIIPLHEENERFPVNGRELFQQLGIGGNYTTWFNRQFAFGFVENQDFQTLSNFGKRADGTVMPTATIDHNMTISMAKEICMLQRTEQGRTVRKYLSAVEEAWNSPDAVINRALKISAARVQDLMDNVSKLESDNTALNQKIQQDAPKVNFANSFAVAKTNILIREFAKILCQHGYQTGEKRLYDTLRKEGYLISSGSDYNLPTQRSAQNGWFYVKVRAGVTADDTHLQRTAMVTPKGQEYFLRHFCGDRYMTDDSAACQQVPFAELAMPTLPVGSIQ